MRDGDRIGTLAFAADAMVEDPLRERMHPPAPQRAELARDGTDLGAAIRRGIMEARGDIVLIVEDNGAQALAITGLLEGAGFSVLRAANGHEALRLVHSEAPDLVVTDLWMPEMDGFALIEAIKKDDPFVPVILIDSGGSSDTAIEAVKEGAYDYLLMPVENDRLVESVQRALKVRHSSDGCHRPDEAEPVRSDRKPAGNRW